LIALEFVVRNVFEFMEVSLRRRMLLVKYKQNLGCCKYSGPKGKTENWR